MSILKKVSSDVWVLETDKLNEGREFSIHWTDFCTTQCALSRRRSLLKSSKAFVEAWIVTLESKMGTVSPRTILNTVLRLKLLVNWMLHRNIFAFSDLSADDLSAYINVRKNTREGRIASRRYLQTHVYLLTLLWELQHYYPQPLRTKPDAAGGVDECLAHAGASIAWRPLAEEHAIPVMKEAFRWADEITPFLIAILEDLRTVEEAAIGKNSEQRRKFRSKRYKEISSTEKFGSLCVMTGLASDDTSNSIRTTVQHCYAALALIILFLTGIRGAELLSLKRQCVKSVPHDDGHEYTYIQGIAAKKASTTRMWIAPKPVVEAIAALERLAEARLYEPMPYLFFSFSGNGSTPDVHTQVRRTLNTTKVATLCRNFIEANVPEVASQLRRQFHLHQARKTFARFTVKRDKRSLEALSQHYGHAMRAYTDANYVGADIPLCELIDEENRRDLAEGLTDLITSKNVGGKGGAAIQGFLQDESSGRRFRGKRAITKMVERMLAEGVVLAPCDWGYCLYSKDLSACKGNDNGPNQILRNPSTCSSCKNFAVTEKHRSWWEERYKREDEFLRKDGLSSQAIELCKARVEESKEIIRGLNFKRLITEN